MHTTHDLIELLKVTEDALRMVREIPSHPTRELDAMGGYCNDAVCHGVMDAFDNVELVKLKRLVADRLIAHGVTELCRCCDTYLDGSDHCSECGCEQYEERC